MYVIYNTLMDNKIVSIREIQRNYRKLIDRVKETGRPLYLGARLKAEAVLLDVGVFEDLKNKARKKESWQEVKKRLDWIAGLGRQNVNLSQFIHEDRQRH